LCSAVMHWRGLDVDIATFYSRDGGATWKLGTDLAAPGMHFADPTLAFGPDGDVYLAHVRLDRTNPAKSAKLGSDDGGNVQFHASLDGGATWEKRAVVARNIDRPWIAIDTTNGPNRGTLYCIGNIEQPITYP